MSRLAPLVSSLGLMVVVAGSQTGLVSAETGQRALFLPRVVERNAVTVDGKLDEAIWQKKEASLATLFLKNSTDIPKRPTKIYGVCDRKTIYFAWRCEEASEADVADRKFERDGNNLWQNDCVEVFVQTGFQGGTFYHFIGEVNGQRWDGKQDVETWNPSPDWTFATSRKGARWTAEASIPVACLGLRSAAPGDFVKVLFAREDWTFVGTARDDPKKVRLECWPAVTTLSFNSNASYRRLYFETDNLLPSLASTPGKNGLPAGYLFPIYKEYKPYIPKNPPKARFDPDSGTLRISIPPTEEGYQIFLRTFAWLHPEQPYRWSLRAKGVGEMRIWPSTNTQPRVHQELKGEPGKDGLIPLSVVLSTRDVKRNCMFEVPLHFDASAEERHLLLKDMRLERLEGVSGLGYKCLTGNAPHALANADTGATLSVLRGGMDESLIFSGHPRGRDLKLNESPLFDGDADTTAAFVSGKTGSDHYPKGVDLIVDLKKNYFVRGVSLTTKLPDIWRVNLSVRPAGRKEFALVNKFEVKSGPSFHANLESIDSTARWVRLRLYAVSRWHGRTIQMSELQIWGEPAGKHTEDEINYLLVEEGKVVPNRPLPQMIVGPLAPHIYPQPREVKYSGSDFVLTEHPRIVISENADRRDRFTAGEIKRILKEQFGLDGEIVKSERAGDAIGAIAVGQIEKSAMIRKLARKRRAKPPTGKDSHEGYGLYVGAKGVVIAGSDAGGTFYGGQSFCQLLYHDKDRVMARGVQVKDWPYIPFRSIQRSLPSRASFRIAEWKNVIRGFARMRINAMWVTPDPIKLPAFPTRRWGLSVEQMRDLTTYAENYNIQIIPHIGLLARYSITGDSSQYEHRPGERASKIYRKARSCPCPSNPKVYETIDRYLGDCDKVFPSKIWSVSLAHEMFHESEGSRWNVCTRCKARGLSDRDLWVDFVNNVVTLFEKYNRIPMIEGSTSLWTSRLMGALERTNIDWNKAIMQSYGFSSEKKVTKKYLVDAGVKQSLLWYMDCLENDFKQKELWGDTFPWGVVYTTWQERNQATWKGDDFYMELCRSIPLHWNPLAERGTHLQQEREAFELLQQYIALSDLVNYPSRRHDVPDRYTPLDLSPVFNEVTIDAKPGDRRGWTDRGPNYDLRNLPTGDQEFGGVSFRLVDGKGGTADNCVSVTKLAVEKRVAKLPVGRKVDSIVFLHGLTNRNDRTVCHYLFEYEDGEQVLTPLWGNVSVRPWSRKPPENRRPQFIGRGLLVGWTGSDETWSPAHVGEGYPAWTGMIPCGHWATLYGWEWVNPYPGKLLKAIHIMPPSEQKEDLAWLLAATAVNVPIAKEKFWLGPLPQKRRLSENVTRLASLRKDKYELAGGEIERKNLEGDRCIYAAPDGTRVLTNAHFSNIQDGFQETGMAETYRYSELQMLFTFPEPRKISGIALRTKHGHLELHELRLFNIELAVSDDGADFRPIGGASHAGTEVDGLLMFSCNETNVKKLRLTVTPRPGMKGDHYWESAGVELLEIYK